MSQEHRTNVMLTDITKVKENILLDDAGDDDVARKAFKMQQHLRVK